MHRSDELYERTVFPSAVCSCQLRASKRKRALSYVLASQPIVGRGQSGWRLGPTPDEHRLEQNIVETLNFK